MQPRTLVLPAASLLLAGFAHAQYFEARNFAMGGAGVASSHYLAAGWANPALLTKCRDTDRFGLILPTVGVLANDKDGLLQDVEDFVDELDRLEASGSPTQGELNALADQLQDLSGRQVTGNANVGFMFAAPSRDLAWAIHAHTFADLQAFVDVDAADIAALQGGSIPGTFASEARVLGVAVTELGFSLATGFDLGGALLAIGATPKLQRVDSYNYAVNADNYDSGDFDNDQYRNDDDSFNVDVGASIDPGLGLTFGAVARNLVEKDYTTVNTLGQQFLYEINPTASLGAAWSTGLLTLAADVDINTKKRFRDTIALTKDDVQLFHLGAEFDLLGWLQLRGGYQNDLENSLDDMWTAGLGLSPFEVFHIDLAGSYVSDESYGGVIQFALTF